MWSDNFDSMEEELEIGEGVEVQHQNKDDGYSLNPELPEILKPQECEEISQDRNMVEAREHLHPGLFSDGAGVMVEELTVKSCNGSTLDIGTLKNPGSLHKGWSPWRHVYQPFADSRVGRDCIIARKKFQATSGAGEDFGSMSSREILAGKSVDYDHGNVVQHLSAAEHTAEQKEDEGDAREGMQTKTVHKSGFVEYFSRSTLKGKGVVCKGPSSNGLYVESRDQNLMKSGIDIQMDSNAFVNSGLMIAESPYNATVPGFGGSDTDGVTLREWLKSKHHKGSKTEHLSIFKKIVDLVGGSHSQGAAMHNLYPSYIKLLPSKDVMCLGLPTQKQKLDNIAKSEVLQPENSLNKKRPWEKVTYSSLNLRMKKQKFIANDIKVNTVVSQDYCNEYKEDIQISNHNIRRTSRIPHISNAGPLQLTSLNERLEEEWYTSPEGGCTILSNIYSLGVLFFEVHSLDGGCPFY